MARRLAWLAAALLLLLPAVLLLAALDAKPLVERGGTISPRSVAQARQLLASNDPRRLQKGEERTVAIPAALLDDGINHLAGRFLHGRAALVLTEDAGEIRFTSPVPGLSRFLNLRATVREADRKLRISRASLGSLPLPPALLESGLRMAVSAAGYDSEWALARQAVRRLDFQPAEQAVVIAYVWEPEILARARSVALSPDDVAHIKEAQSTFAALLDHRAQGARIPLVSILKPLLPVAGDNLRERRRAALLVLATYLAEKDLAALVPEARAWPRPRLVELTARGRYDSAQHFAISAALAAWAGEPVADAIGLYKEIDDTRHGSGFSFADLAADRAGTRFGELVAGNGERIEAALAGPLGEGELLPRLEGLPEYLYEGEFRRRFGAPGSAAYRQLTDEIERRLATLPIYR